jgi:hypothetical protein
MLNKIVNGKMMWIPVVAGESVEAAVTADGIVMNETYSLTWKMEHSGKQKELIRLSGKELIKRTTNILNSCFCDPQNGKYLNLGDLKYITQRYINLYGIGLSL